MFIFGGNTPQDTQYKIERSLRFNSADSAYLARTPITAGNRKTWTWSGWVKRSGSTDLQTFFSSVTGTADTNIRFNADSIDINQRTSAITNWQVTTAAKYRDYSAWYHIVVAVDTTQSVASDRVKLYVNGQLVTAFSTASYPTQNSDTYVNNNISHAIGDHTSLSRYFSGYLTEVHFIDGASLDASYFGQIDSETGVWSPKQYEVEGLIEYVIVAGGGGGGSEGTNVAKGGGGAGGYRASVVGETSGGGAAAEPRIGLIKGVKYPLTIGAGGAVNVSGSNAIFSNITALGGGAGCTFGSAPEAGGSGGGGYTNRDSVGGITTAAGGLGTTGQGYAGGGGGASPTVNNSGYGAGGGGASAAGATGSTNNTGGNGGAGLSTSITGSSVARAGGGGGGSRANTSVGTGGTGGGGSGGGYTSPAAQAGTANTGGGGGGGGGLQGTGTGVVGQPGGSATVILRYPSTYTATFSAGVTQTTSTVGSNKVSIVTAAGPTDTVTFS